MIHDLILPIHILAGMIALIVGYVALFAAKGGRLHRRTGKMFVFAMVVMGLGGSFLAAIDPDGSPTNIVAGLVTFYLVMTAMLTARKGWRPGRIGASASEWSWPQVHSSSGRADACRRSSTSRRSCPSPS